MQLHRRPEVSTESGRAGEKEARVKVRRGDADARGASEFAFGAASVGTLAQQIGRQTIEDIPDGEPYERLFTAKQDYFTVYHANAVLVMQINQAELRHSIFKTYLRAKGLLDTISMNRLYLERYHYLQSTFLKTRDPSAQSAFEHYRQMLIQIAAQLRRADEEFRNHATDLLQLLSDRDCKPWLNTSHARERIESRPLLMG